MVTHQNDFQRMAFMSWALGHYNIYQFIETGCGEGETIGYFGQFAKFAGGCDIRPEVIEIARNRYPHIAFYTQDAREYLKEATPYDNAFFYLDCTWLDCCYAKEQLPTIFGRWNRPIVFVSGVIVNNGSKGQQPVSDLTPYGRVIVPKYCQASDMSGYALIVPGKISPIHLPKDSWEIV